MAPPSKTSRKAAPNFEVAAFKPAGGMPKASAKKPKTAEQAAVQGVVGQELPPWAATSITRWFSSPNVQCSAVAIDSDILVWVSQMDDELIRDFAQTIGYFRSLIIQSPERGDVHIQLPGMWGHATKQVRDQEVQRLVDASESKASKADAIQARMRAKAVELVMNGTSWLTATELFDELPKKPSNAHTVLARWLTQGRIFAMEKSGVRIYPRYAFDAMVEPVPLLKEVLKELAGRSPFQIASWFESPSNYLDGKRPREVLETNGLAVVTAAQRLVEGAIHG